MYISDFSKHINVYDCFMYIQCIGCRVLARISKNACPKQQFQNICRPDLATNQLQILIPTKINCLVCQKRARYSLAMSGLEDGLLGKYLVITPQKVIIEKSSYTFLPVQTVGF